jgi:hypothetical protein
LKWHFFWNKFLETIVLLHSANNSSQFFYLWSQNVYKFVCYILMIIMCTFTQDVHNVLVAVFCWLKHT